MDKHTQVPNDMSKDGLTPKEQLIYAILHLHNNKDNECYPSLQTIAEESTLSVPTVRECIKRLIDAEYISVQKKNRRNYYYFKKYINFEPFSKEFLLRKDITPLTKSYLIAIQKLMYKDVEGVGKLSYSNAELSKRINMPESSIWKSNKELENKNFLVSVDNKLKDVDTGFSTKTKIYKLKQLGQEIIWKLTEHEERIEKNSEDIAILTKKLEEQQKLIDKLLKEREVSQTEFYI